MKHHGEYEWEHGIPHWGAVGRADSTALTNSPMSHRSAQDRLEDPHHPSPSQDHHHDRVRDDSSEARGVFGVLIFTPPVACGLVAA